MKRFLIGIPLFNSQNSLPCLFKEIFNEIDPNIYDLLFIDNCSSDNTVGLTNALKSENMFLIQNQFNVGLGGSQKKIFDYARSKNYEIVGIFHSDLQPVVADIVKGFNLIDAQKDVESLLGTRFHPHSKRIGYSGIRTIGNYVLNIYYSIIYMRIIWDLGSGLNIYRVNSLPVYEDLPNDLSFNCNLLIRQLTQKKRIVWLPITWREGVNGSSARVFRLANRTLAAPFKYRKRKKVEV
jgi:dolichol-phosphate mannosyltransferase